MRVIAGSARRLLLKSLPGDDTRPTTDQIKETLFNMINFDIPGAYFLDLYSGTGAIAIEALSRGAGEAVLVDNNPKACEVIKENLRHTHFEESAQVFNSDAVGALRKLENRTERPFSIVFMDPPYGKGLENLSLNYLKDSKLIDFNTQIILETSKDTDVTGLSDMGYDIFKIKDYKSNKHVFMRKKQ